jgi:hypothetical protein
MPGGAKSSVRRCWFRLSAWCVGPTYSFLFIHRRVGGRYRVGRVGRKFQIGHGRCGRDEDEDRRDHQDQELQVLGLRHDNLHVSDVPNVGFATRPVSEVRRTKLVMYSPCPTRAHSGPGLAQALY